MPMRVLYLGGSLATCLLIDVIVPATVGTVCASGAACANVSHTPRDSSGGLTSYALHVWPSIPYYFGASSLDLFGAASLRLLGFALLTALCLSRRKRTRTPRTLLEPLNAAVIAAERGTAEAVEDGRGDDDARARAMSHRSTAWTAAAISAATWIHISGKALARLLQSGTGHGDGFHVLPLVTSPPEMEFWACMLVALATSECERRLFVALSSAVHGKASVSEHATATHPASAAAAPKSAAESAADASAEMKKAYVKSTEPQEVQTVRLMLSMMAPDAHLLLLAYTSLIIAAAGESVVPWLYGLTIDSIAIKQVGGPATCLHTRMLSHALAFTSACLHTRCKG